MKQDRRNFLTTTAATILGTTTAGKTTGKRNSTLSETADNLLEPAESQQEWSRVNKDLQNTSRNPNTRVPDQNTQTITETEENNFHQDSVTIFDKDQIYIGGWSKGSVQAFDRQNGEKQWEASMGGNIHRPFSVSDDFVYISSTGSAELAAIDKYTGEKEHTAQLTSSGNINYVDGKDKVVVTESTGTARVFDEDLSNERVFDDHHAEVNIARETTVVDDDRIIYAERENSEPAHLMMLDFDAEVIDSKPIDGEANDGAVLHNDLFIYNEDGDMVAIEITENGIGDEQWRTDTGDYGNNRLSPVAYKDHVIQGNNDGELHAVNTKTGDKVVVDSDFDDSVYSLVAGEHTLAVGGNSRFTALYDLEEAVQGDAEPVKVFDEDEWGFNTPIAVLDGKLYTQNFGSSGGFGVHEIDGDYRDIPEPEITDLSVVNPTSVYGDDTTAQPEVENSERADYFELEIETQDENWKNQYTDLSEIDLNEPIFEDMDNPGPGTYEVTVRAYQEDNIVDEKTVETTLEELNHDITRK